MKNALGQLIDDIVKEETKNLYNVVGYMGRMIEADWTIYSRRVMDDYYRDYQFTTQRYKQTGSLRNVVEPVHRQRGGKHTAGIRLDPERMYHGELPQFNEEGILDNFMSGMHGNIPYTIPGTGEKISRYIQITRPSAEQMLDNYYHRYDSRIDKFFEDGRREYAS